MSDFNFKPQDQASNRPERVEPPAPRPEPKKQVDNNVSPWFVSEETHDENKIDKVAKKTVKRSITVIFPILGVIVVLGAIMAVLATVGQIYG